MSAAIKAAKARRSGNPGMPGGHHRGDPGLFGAIGGAIRGGIGALSRGGNPVLGAARGARRGFMGRTGAQEDGSISLPIALPGIGSIGGPGKNPGTAVAKGSSSALVPLIPRGYHLNKSSYWLRDGTFVPKGTKLVKNRRRDPLNARALRRAISRVDAGKVWQSKLSEITTAKYTAAGKRKD